MVNHPLGPLGVGQGVLGSVCAEKYSITCYESSAAPEHIVLPAKRGTLSSPSRCHCPNTVWQGSPSLPW